MSFTDLLVDTFYPITYTLADDGTGGRTESGTEGTAFLGRLSSAPVVEKLSGDKTTVFRSHVLFCEGTVSLTEAKRVRTGTRYFEIKGVRNPSNTSHHLEIDLLEII